MEGQATPPQRGMLSEAPPNVELDQGFAKGVRHSATVPLEMARLVAVSLAGFELRLASR